MIIGKMVRTNHKKHSREVEEWIWINFYGTEAMVLKLLNLKESWKELEETLDETWKDLEIDLAKIPGKEFRIKEWNLEGRKIFGWSWGNDFKSYSRPGNILGKNVERNWEET